MDCGVPDEASKCQKIITSETTKQHTALPSYHYTALPKYDTTITCRTQVKRNQPMAGTVTIKWQYQNMALPKCVELSSTEMELHYHYMALPKYGTTITCRTQVKRNQPMAVTVLPLNGTTKIWQYQNVQNSAQQKSANGWNCVVTKWQDQNMAVPKQKWNCITTIWHYQNMAVPKCAELSSTEINQWLEVGYRLPKYGTKNVLINQWL